MTRLLYRNLSVAAIVLLAGCLASYAVQAPTAPAKKVFDGQLTKVDVEMKTIAVRGNDNREMRFLYTNQTEIVGAHNDAQGLAGTLGTRVRVEYTEKSGIATASKIEVLPKEATQ